MVTRPLIFDFLVEPEDAGMRLDVFLAEQEDPPLTRSQVRKRLDAGEILVNEQLVKPGYALRVDDCIRWQFTPARAPSLTPQDIPITLLFDDAEIAIVDKPAGMVVHPAPGHPDHTLVNALLHQFDDLAGIGGELRPGIVHRLDKDTSGALAITKTDHAHQLLAAQFRARSVQRTYHALVVDPGLSAEGTFNTFHQRDPHHRLRFSGRVESTRRAITHYRVLERFASGSALVECNLETGRTHQIRMHFFEANAPLLGDALYGSSASAASGRITRQALHARRLGLTHPDGRTLVCEAPYPDDFAHALDALRQGKSWR